MAAAALAWALVCICWIVFKHFLVNSLSIRDVSARYQLTLSHEDLQGGRSLLFFRPMDLNSAGAEDLALIPMIGKKRAASIVSFRQNMGFLLSVEELASPNGPISPRLLDKIRPYLFIGGQYE